MGLFLGFVCKLDELAGKVVLRQPVDVGIVNYLCELLIELCCAIVHSAVQHKRI